MLQPVVFRRQPQLGCSITGVLIDQARPFFSLSHTAGRFFRSIMKSMTYSKTVPFSIDFSFFSFFLYRRAHIEIDAKRKKYGRRVPSGDRSITDYWTWCAFLAAVFPIELRCFGSSSSFIIRKPSYLLVICIGLVMYHSAKV